MPIYEYRCKDCAHVFEEWQKDFEDRIETCPACGGQAPRIISNTSFILKGSGWYVTDYARGNGNGKSASGNGTNGKASTNAEPGTAADSPKSAESKPAESSTATSTPAATKSSDSASS